MAKAQVKAGICGFQTMIRTEKGEGYQVEIAIETECPDIQQLAKVLDEVNAFEQISFRKGIPEILELGHEHCTHASCPVPAAIIKAVEIEAGLALPEDVEIQLSKE